MTNRQIDILREGERGPNVELTSDDIYHGADWLHHPPRVYAPECLLLHMRALAST